MQAHSWRKSLTSHQLSPERQRKEGKSIIYSKTKELSGPRHAAEAGAWGRQAGVLDAGDYTLKNSDCCFGGNPDIKRAVGHACAALQRIRAAVMI